VSWLAVTRNDLRAAGRSKAVWLLPVLFLLGFGGLAYAVVEADAPDFDTFLSVAAAAVALLLPLVGIVLGHRSVVRERESGRIVLLMALPNSRAEMVAGTLLGRAVVLAGSLAVGLAGAGLVMATGFDAFAPGRYLLFSLVALAYGLVFLAIATGLSMALSTSRKVVAAAFGVYLLLVSFWTELVSLLVVVLFRFDTSTLTEPPLWAQSLTFLNPRTTFVYLLGEVLDVGSGPTALDLGTQWFASPEVALAVLLAWILAPLGLGYVRFRRVEF
jgi:ABC-2 type transport system permease protein